MNLRGVPVCELTALDERRLTAHRHLEAGQIPVATSPACTVVPVSKTRVIFPVRLQLPFLLSFPPSKRKVSEAASAV